MVANQPTCNSLNSAKLSRNFAFLTVFGVFSSLFFLLGTSAEAKTFTTNVTVLKYYGYLGQDRDAGHLYGAKIRHGDYIYRVELKRPMPCLGKHVNQIETVTVKKRGDQWQSVTFNGNYSEIHRVVRLEDACNGHGSLIGDVWSRIWSPITDLW